MKKRKDPRLVERNRGVETGTISIFPLTLDRWNDLIELFGPNGACAGCWCMWWRLNSREFRKGSGATNQKRFRGCVEESVPPGILAYRREKPIGWCAVAPREKYRRLASSRIFKPIDQTSVWAITCFYIARAERRHGLTVRLIEAACSFAASFGATEIEAYPRISPDREFSPLSLYMGTEDSFARAGFRIVSEPSPIRRLMRMHI
jgi:GNAT superfamily N-acetyltransferase